VMTSKCALHVPEYWRKPNRYASLVCYPDGRFYSGLVSPPRGLATEMRLELSVNEHFSMSHLLNYTMLFGA
jgi:hypothetical protein